MPSATPNPEPPIDAPASASPPQAPLPLTPGKHAALFTKLYHDCLTATLGSVSYSTFAECFPSLPPDVLRSVHHGMVSKLQQFAENEFETIMVERRVVENLNRLEEIIEEARRKKARGVEGQVVVAPHTLPPKRLVDGYVNGVLNSQQSQLNAKLQTAQSQNASLMERMAEQRKEIEGLMKGLKGVVDDLEGAGEVVGKEGEGLGVESRGAEEVIGDVEMGGR